MSDAVKCDGCQKVILLDSNEIDAVVHVRWSGNEGLDFHNRDCAFHWFKDVHDEATCEFSEIEGPEEPRPNVRDLAEYRRHEKAPH